MARWRAAAFVAAFVLAAALALLPEEFGHYRYLSRPPQDVGVRLAILAATLAKSLAVLAPVAVLGVIVALAGWFRLAAGLAVGATALWVILIAANLSVQRVTGNLVFDHLALLANPDAVRWAGEGFEFGPALARPARIVVTSLAAAAFVGAVVAWGRRRALIAVSLTWALLIVATLVAQRVIPAGRFVQRVHDLLPFVVHAGLHPTVRTVSDFQDRLDELYASGREALLAAGPGAAPELPVLERPPDVVLVVLESLRHDALTPEVMPNLWALSERGLRAERHYAGANASHFGLYSLLYGRSAVNYFASLRANVAPPLARRLAEVGYKNHYLTAGDPAWLEMENFLGPGHFETETFAAHGSSNWQRDRAGVDRARALLREPSEQPRFLVVFLMSTHFGYEFPPEQAFFQPSAPSPNALDPQLSEQRASILNRYKNAAHFLDALLAPWWREIEARPTLLIVTGDHGESIFDDGMIAHAGPLSEIQTRVPFVASGFGRRRVEKISTHERVLAMVLGRLAASRPVLPALVPTALGDCVTLVRAQPNDRSHEELVFLSGADRLGVRLDRGTGKVSFEGLLGRDGRAITKPISDEQSEAFLACFSSWLEREGAAPAAPLERARGS